MKFRSIISLTTRRSVRYDLKRLIPVIKSLFRKNIVPKTNKLHLGCGSKRVTGWLNTDIKNSDYDVDFISNFPWQENAFDYIVSLHVIEHFELERELIPIFKEIHRVARDQAEIWLSTPDLAIICNSYTQDKCKTLLIDRVKRMPGWKIIMNGIPSQHIINHFFHQMNQHKNLYDYELLKWALDKSGFSNVKKVNESIFLAMFPEFPMRNDDLQSLYVKAIAIKS